MPRAVIAIAILLLTSAQAEASLIISEYVEGTGQNQAIELYNTSGSSLGLGGWAIEVYTNGSSTPSLTVSLSGTVATDDVFIIVRDGAAAALLALADTTSTDLNFNGNDAIVLTQSGVAIDSIGQVGVNPGSQWGSGLTSTRNNTLRRINSVTIGDSNLGDAFDPSGEWVGFASNTFDGLGARPVPESGTREMLLLGFAGLALWRRRHGPKLLEASASFPC